MSKCVRGFIGVAAMALAVTWCDEGRAQTSTPIGAAPITHVAVVVEDIDAAVRGYAAMFGIPIPDVTSRSVDLPGGGAEELRVASIPLANFRVEVNQPADGSGPVSQFLQQFGPGIHRIGFGVSGDIAETRRTLLGHGGTWTAGTEGGRYAWVDFRNRLGATLELVPRESDALGAASAEGAAGDGLLAGHPVRHVGIAVRDTDEAAMAYAEVLGVTVAEPRDYKDAQYPPGSEWNLDSYIRVISWRQENVGIELLGAVGSPNPWSDYVDRYNGNAAQHISIGIGEGMREAIRQLQIMGGEWTNGKEGGTYAYLDFSDQLGIVFEINGAAGS